MTLWEGTALAVPIELKKMRALALELKGLLGLEAFMKPALFIVFPHGTTIVSPGLRMMFWSMAWPFTNRL